MRIYLLNMLMFFLFAACNQSKKEHHFKYDFENPTEEIRLDKKLDEISGLSFVDGNLIASINDEKGKIYLIDLKTFKQSKSIDFKDKGDFEGIQKIADVYYVLESNGDLFKVKKDGTYKKYKLFEKGFEFEGLAVTPSGKSLLIACKKHKGKKSDGFIWIYEFNLNSKKLKKEPYLKLKKEKIKQNFRPSGIAFHPGGNLFIVSGVSRTIIELNPENEILNQTQLPEFKFSQVEGICFDLNGGLYLSSEKDYLEKGKLIYLKQK